MNVDLVKAGATYATKRASYYPNYGEQLDLLYHAITAGEFGEGAKTSAFYTERKTVKDKYPE